MKSTLYKVLAISISQESSQKIAKLNQNPNIEIISVTDEMDFLEYLIDSQVDGLIINTEISMDTAVDLLEKISNDYENKATPIVLISDHQNCTTLVAASEACNVISTFTCSNWDIQLEHLLNYLQTQTTQTNELKKELRQSEVRNVIDPLTGAFNRYGAQDRFYDLTSRYKAYEEPFCAVMFDVDHFKNINDTFGHDIGDEVLKELSTLVKNSIRANDALIRLGGEEFFIFLSNVQLQNAAEIAEKIRATFEITPVTSRSIHITSSFGVAEYLQNEDLDSLIKRADLLLYQAKKSGRNKVLSK